MNVSKNPLTRSALAAAMAVRLSAGAAQAQAAQHGAPTTSTTP